jgi:hypothetical protein
MTLPNVIIAGAPKCGTSSLYFWLAAHPDACASKAKETFYFADDVNRFNKGLNFIENGLELYQKHFEHCKGSKVIFEATAPYIYHQNALEQIATLETKPKVIFLLREPSKRMMSQYLFERYRTGRKQMELNEYIKLPGLLQHGEYSGYLKQWEEAIGRDRMLVYIFEEFMGDTVAGMKDMAGKLGLDPTFYDGFDFTTRNETLKMKSTALHRAGLKIQEYVPHWLQAIILPLYLKFNSSGKPQATEAEKQLLKDEVVPYYKEEKSRMEEFLGRQITAWS